MDIQHQLPLLKGDLIETVAIFVVLQPTGLRQAAAGADYSASELDQPPWNAWLPGTEAHKPVGTRSDAGEHQRHCEAGGRFAE